MGKGWVVGDGWWWWSESSSTLVPPAMIIYLQYLFLLGDAVDPFFLFLFEARDESATKRKMLP